MIRSSKKGKVRAAEYIIPGNENAIALQDVKDTDALLGGSHDHHDARTDGDLYSDYYHNSFFTCGVKDPAKLLKNDPNPSVDPMLSKYYSHEFRMAYFRKYMPLGASYGLIDFIKQYVVPNTALTHALIDHILGDLKWSETWLTIFELGPHMTDGQIRRFIRVESTGWGKIEHTRNDGTLTQRSISFAADKYKTVISESVKHRGIFARYLLFNSSITINRFDDTDRAEFLEICFRSGKLGSDSVYILCKSYATIMVQHSEYLAEVYAQKVGRVARDSHDIHLALRSGGQFVTPDMFGNLDRLETCTLSFLTDALKIGCVVSPALISKAVRYKAGDSDDWISTVADFCLAHDVPSLPSIEGNMFYYKQVPVIVGALKLMKRVGIVLEEKSRRKLLGHFKDALTCEPKPGVSAAEVWDLTGDVDCFLAAVDNTTPVSEIVSTVSPKTPEDVVKMCDCITGRAGDVGEYLTKLFETDPSLVFNVMTLSTDKRWCRQSSNNELTFSNDDKTVQRVGSISFFPAAFCDVTSVQDSFKVRVDNVGRLNYITFGLTERGAIEKEGSGGVGRLTNSWGIWVDCGRYDNLTKFYSSAREKAFTRHMLRDGDTLFVKLFLGINKANFYVNDVLQIVTELPSSDPKDYQFAMTFSNDSKVTILNNSGPTLYGVNGFGHILSGVSDTAKLFEVMETNAELEEFVKEYSPKLHRRFLFHTKQFDKLGINTWCDIRDSAAELISIDDSDLISLVVQITDINNLDPVCTRESIPYEPPVIINPAVRALIDRLKRVFMEQLQDTETTTELRKRIAGAVFKLEMNAGCAGICHIEDAVKFRMYFTLARKNIDNVTLPRVLTLVNASARFGYPIPASTIFEKMSKSSADGGIDFAVFVNNIGAIGDVYDELRSAGQSLTGDSVFRFVYKYRNDRAAFIRGCMSKTDIYTAFKMTYDIESIEMFEEVIAELDARGELVNTLVNNNAAMKEMFYFTTVDDVTAATHRSRVRAHIIRKYLQGSAVLEEFTLFADRSVVTSPEAARILFSDVI